jgi:hypothetical protein
MLWCNLRSCTCSKTERPLWIFNVLICEHCSKFIPYYQSKWSGAGVYKLVNVQNPNFAFHLALEYFNKVGSAYDAKFVLSEQLNYPFLNQGFD